MSLVVESEREVGVADAIEHGGLDFRLGGQLRIDSLCALIENFADGHAIKENRRMGPTRRLFQEEPYSVGA